MKSMADVLEEEIQKLTRQRMQLVLQKADIEEVLKATNLRLSALIDLRKQIDEQDRSGE